jgi:hypothetical protein
VVPVSKISSAYLGDAKAIATPVAPAPQPAVNLQQVQAQERAATAVLQKKSVAAHSRAQGASIYSLILIFTFFSG